MLRPVSENVHRTKTPLPAHFQRIRENFPVDKGRKKDIIELFFGKSDEKASRSKTGQARGETVKAPCRRRTAATLEQSATSGTVHPR